MHMNNTNNLEAIGKRISLTRRAKGMTQENLAEKLGVKSKTYFTYRMRYFVPVSEKSH